MDKEEEQYLVALFDDLLETYTLEQLLENSDYSVPELLAVLVDLQYLELPKTLPL